MARACSRQAGHSARCAATRARSIGRQRAERVELELVGDVVHRDCSRWLALDLERAPQLLQPDAHPALHGAERNAHQRGQLDVGVPAEVRELDRAALRLRETLERGAHRLVLDVALGGLRGVVIRGALGGRLKGRRAEGRLAPEDVDGAVVDDRHQPAADVAALAPVARRPAPGRDVRVVDDVLRGLALAQDPVGERVGQAAVAVVEGRERTEIALGQRHDQDVVRLVGSVRHLRGLYGRRPVADEMGKKASRANCLRALPLHRCSAAWPWSRSSISSRTAFDAISGCAPGDRRP